jgi:ABC-type branched-subunit amino acid transport system substrate-binding protein
LHRAKQPVFMWNINPQFARKADGKTPEVHPTFFAQNPALCFNCAGHGLPWLAKTLGATKVGVLAYSVDQSKECAAGVRASFEKYPTAEIAFFDDTLSYAQQVSAQVREMKQKGVDYVTTCVDLQESFTIAKELEKQGLQAFQSLPQGYDSEFVAQNGELLEGAYVGLQFTAFEHEPQIDEIKKLNEWAAKDDVEVTELVAVGWQLGDMLYTGLAGAGPEFTQEKVVNYLNTLTAYTDNGFLDPINWTIGHIDPTNDESVRIGLECTNYVKVEGGQFVPVFGEPGKPWVCFDPDDPTVDTPQYLSFAP